MVAIQGNTFADFRCQGQRYQELESLAILLGITKLITGKFFTNGTVQVTELDVRMILLIILL